MLRQTNLVRLVSGKADRQAVQSTCSDSNNDNDRQHTAPDSHATSPHKRGQDRPGGTRGKERVVRASDRASRHLNHVTSVLHTQSTRRKRTRRGAGRRSHREGRWKRPTEGPVIGQPAARSRALLPQERVRASGLICKNPNTASPVGRLHAVFVGALLNDPRAPGRCSRIGTVCAAGPGHRCGHRRIGQRNCGFSKRER